MNTRLKRYMHALTGEQQERFARLAGTTVGYIRHLVTGRREASSELAIKMEKAAVRLNVEGAPVLGRRQLSAACKDCEYAKACTERLD